jgi:glycosyltransferase involved in cell wall biosynthesis/ubiquinone/menaquinone biosynthesis C-methylase UbiE/Flp pilus assembly protein TadD
MEDMLSRDIPDLHSYLRWKSIATFVHADRSTLDIGCNVGTMTLEVARRSSARVRGIDIDEQCLRLAEERIRRAGLENCTVEYGSATAIPFDDGTFDQILIADVLEHVIDDAKVIDECFRVLRPGGRLILNVPRPNYSRLFNPDWIRHIGHVRDGYELTDLERLLEGSFQIEAHDCNSRAAEELDDFYNKGHRQITEERLDALFAAEADESREAFGLTVVATRVEGAVRHSSPVKNSPAKDEAHAPSSLGRSGSSMRILHVAWGHPPNLGAGPIYYLHQLCLEERSNGVEAACFVAGNEQGDAHLAPSVSHRVYDGVSYHVVENRPAKYFDWEYPRREIDNDEIALLFEQTLSDWQPDVVHFHNLLSLSMSLIEAAKERGIPTVFSAHNYWTVCARDDLFAPNEVNCSGPGDGARCASCIGQPNQVGGYMYRARRSREILTNSIDVILAVSTRVKEILVSFGVPADRIVAQHIGSRAAEHNWKQAGERGRLTVPAHETVRFGFFGTMHVRKGAHVLLAAAAKLAARRTDFRLDVYGGGLQGGFKERLDLLLASSPVLRGVCELKGGYLQTQMPELLKEIDIAIIPPVWEDNGPQTVMETLGAGVPVIGSAIGGIPDFVADGRNGLLFRPGDTDDLARVMERVLDDRSLLATLRQGIQPPLTIPEHEQELRELYERLIEEQEKRKSNGVPSPDRLVRLGWKALDQGRIDDAAHLFQSAGERSPEFIDAKMGMAIVLQLREQPDEATVLLREILERMPAHPMANNELGAFLYQNGDAPAALTCFKNAVAGDPRYLPALKNLGDLSLATGDDVTAVSMYGQVLRIAPTDIDGLMGIGSITLKNGQWKTAAHNFERVLELSPDHPTAGQLLAAVREQMAPAPPRPRPGRTGVTRPERTGRAT